MALYINPIATPNIPKPPGIGMTTALAGMAAIQKAKAAPAAVVPKKVAVVAKAPTTTLKKASVPKVNTGQKNYSTPVYHAPPPDPYAAWGGKANFDKLVNNFNIQKTNIYGSANDAADNAGIGIHGSILDFIDSLRGAQGKVDESAVQNELARRQGATGVMGMVGRGINSAAVTLNNDNAGDSSAGDAVARAYGDIGRRQMSTIGNQYAQGQRAVDMQQADVDTQRASGIRHINDSKTQVVNSIVSDARNSLAALDAAMANASLPDRINIENEKNNVKTQVMSKLAQYDAELTNGANGIAATSPDARKSTAYSLAQAGVAPENAFDYTAEQPADLKQTGPFASDLPIFTFKRKAADLVAGA
jgi:hypothetical protein